MPALGFTGTQKGMTGRQKLAVLYLLQRLKEEGYDTAHHGLCIGADAQFHRLAFDTGFSIIGHPGHDKCGTCNARAAIPPTEFERIEPEDFFLVRNHAIVDSAAILIATPKRFVEELRSGTWATIRHARKTKKGCYIVWPDGSR